MVSKPITGTLSFPVLEGILGLHCFDFSGEPFCQTCKAGTTWPWCLLGISWKNSHELHKLYLQQHIRCRTECEAGLVTFGDFSTNGLKVWWMMKALERFILTLISDRVRIGWKPGNHLKMKKPFGHDKLCQNSWPCTSCLCFFQPELRFKEYQHATLTSSWRKHHSVYYILYTNHKLRIVDLVDLSALTSCQL